MSVNIANELSNPVHTLADLWKLSDRHDDSAPQLGVHGPITKKRKLTLHQRQEALARREGETLASIARSYAFDASMISRLEPQITEPNFLRIGMVCFSDIEGCSSIADGGTFDFTSMSNCHTINYHRQETAITSKSQTLSCCIRYSLAWHRV